MPTYPFLFNPYYHPTIYSSYIPLPYDESNRLIPISQLPYPLIFPTQFPHGSTHIPKIKNPVHVQTYIPPINQIKIQTNDKSEEILLQENTTENLLNQNNYSDDFDHTPLTEFHREEPVNIDEKKYRISKNQDPKRNQILHENTDQFSYTMTMEPNRLNESQEIQQPLLSITVIESDTLTSSSNKINYSKEYNTTSTPISTSEIYNLPNIFKNSVSLIPSNTKYNLSPNESSKTTQFYSQSTTTRVSLLSSTKDETETTTKTQSITNKNNDFEKTSIIKDGNQLNVLQEDLPQLKSSNDKDTTILKSSTEIVNNPMEITKTTNNPEKLIALLFASPYSTTTVPSTHLWETNDYQTSKSSSVTIPDIVTLNANYSYGGSFQTKSAYSTKLNNEYVNQSNLISPSTSQFPMSISHLETTTFPTTHSKSSTITLPLSPEVYTSYKSKPSNSIKDFNETNEIHSTSSLNTILQPLSTISSLSSTLFPEVLTSFKSKPSNSIKDFNETNEIQSSSSLNTTLQPLHTVTSLSSTSSPEVLTSFKSTPSNSIKDFNKNNEIQSTTLIYTTLFSTQQPLNSKDTIISSTFTETPTEKSPSTSENPSINYDNYTKNIKRNTNIPTHYDESTTLISISDFVNHNNFLQLEKNVQNNLPPDINNSSRSYLDGLLLTQKSIKRSDDKTNNNFPVSAIKTNRIPLKSTVTPITPYNRIQRKLPLVTVSNNLKHRKTINDRNQLNPKAKSPSQTYRDSELWYNHMYTQIPYKKELSEGQINFLLKKIIKLLKPEIEKQIVTKDSISRVIVPKLGDQEKLIQIILPIVRDAAKSIKNEEPVKINEKQ